MSKRIDFAKQRRDQGRLLRKTARELAASIESTAQQHGINLHEILRRKAEEQRKLAERLQQSIVPLFINSRAGVPNRLGSCVLVRLESDFFAFTAAHVLRDVGSARLYAPSGAEGGKLLPLPPCSAHLNSAGDDADLDVGVIVLRSSHLGPFQQRVFLFGEEIDQDDRPDDRGLGSFYFVLGYSASRTQVKTSNDDRRIHQQSFHCSTQPVEAAEYLQEGVAEANRILLDFDHKEIVCGGRRVSPPKLQGVSGGGVFQISREKQLGPLVAIATQNRRSSRLIVGTRIKHFLAMVRVLKTNSV